MAEAAEKRLQQEESRGMKDPEGYKKIVEQLEKAEKDVTERIEALLKKDKELGLYSLAPSKNKENICYPEVFTGKIG